MAFVARDGEHTSTWRAWTVVNAGTTYRAICAWSSGSQRMEWSVQVSAKTKSGGRHWRSMRGLWVIAAVREFENAQALNEALQK